MLGAPTKDLRYFSLEGGRDISFRHPLAQEEFEARLVRCPNTGIEF